MQIAKECADPVVEDSADAPATEEGDSSLETPSGSDLPDAPRASRSRESKARRNRRAALPEATTSQLEAIEALLFAADKPLTDGRLAELLSLPEEVPATPFLDAAVRRINRSLDLTGRSMRIRRLAGGWRVMVESRFGALIEAMKGQRTSSRLSPAALETLSVVAYRQPITRAHVEAIRGVACGEVLRGLLERRLVRIAGRAEEVGRPMLYGTTREFLLAFGLGSLSDLPSAKEFAQQASRSDPTPAGGDSAIAGGDPPANASVDAVGGD
jgi:segregation and condensation protein B